MGNYVSPNLSLKQEPGTPPGGVCGTTCRGKTMQTVNQNTTETSSPPAMASPVSEDWIAVGVAAVLIATILLGVRPGPIQFGWTTASDLSQVFGAGNLANWLLLGVYLLIPTVIGARLLGARTLNFAIGFAILYGLATLAQILGGYTGSSSLGLEYVLYALIIGLVLRQVTTIGRQVPRGGAGGVLHQDRTRRPRRQRAVLGTGRGGPPRHRTGARSW